MAQDRGAGCAGCSCGSAAWSTVRTATCGGGATRRGKLWNVLKVDEEAHQEEEQLREQMMRRDHRDRARLRRPEADVRREDELRREVDKGGSAARVTAAAAAATAAHGAYGARGLRVELRGDDEDVGGEAGEQRTACERGVGASRVAEYKHNRLIEVMGGGTEAEAQAGDGHRLPELPEQLVGGEHLQFVSNSSVIRQ